MWQFFPLSRQLQITGLYTAFSTRFPKDYVFRGESHDFYELVMVTEGTVGVTAGTETLILKAPAAILHPPMEFHSIRSEADSTPCITIFSFAAESFPLPQSRIFAINEDILSRAERVMALLRESTDCHPPHAGAPLPGKEKAAQHALLELEILLLLLTENTVTHPQREPSAGARNYRRALQVIEENLYLPLTTADIARLTHISPSLLKKTFARHAGVGVMEYFRTLKINAAIPMLREDISVQEIAARLGFSNAGYFSTVFKRVTGHPPGYYRNR